MTEHSFDLTAGGRHTYRIAQRLAGIAADSLYNFQPGLRTLDLPTFPETLTVTARLSTHPWGISAQAWARDTDGVLHACAEATAGPVDASSAIHTRIRHFRSGSLLWTQLAGPVSTTAINPAHPQVFTSAGRFTYQLQPEHRISGHPIWHLHTDEIDQDHPLFAGVDSAVTHIAEYLEHTPAASRRRRSRTTERSIR